MPGAETRLVGPEREQPDFRRVIERADDLHAMVTRRAFHQMRSIAKRGFHVGYHAVGNDKAAECHKSRRRSRLPACTRRAVSRRCRRVQTHEAVSTKI